MLFFCEYHILVKFHFKLWGGIHHNNYLIPLHKMVLYLYLKMLVKKEAFKILTFSMADFNSPRAV